MNFEDEQINTWINDEHPPQKRINKYIFKYNKNDTLKNDSINMFNELELENQEICMNYKFIQEAAMCIKNKNNIISFVDRPKDNDYITNILKKYCKKNNKKCLIIDDNQTKLMNNGIINICNHMYAHNMLIKGFDIEKIDYVVMYELERINKDMGHIIEYILNRLTKQNTLLCYCSNIMNKKDVGEYVGMTSNKKIILLTNENRVNAVEYKLCTIKEDNNIKVKKIYKSSEHYYNIKSIPKYLINKQNKQHMYNKYLQYVNENKLYPCQLIYENLSDEEIIKSLNWYNIDDKSKETISMYYKNKFNNEDIKLLIDDEKNALNGFAIITNNTLNLVKRITQELLDKGLIKFVFVYYNITYNNIINNVHTTIYKTLKGKHNMHINNNTEHNIILEHNESIMENEVRQMILYTPKEIISNYNIMEQQILSLYDLNKCDIENLIDTCFSDNNTKSKFEHNEHDIKHQIRYCYNQIKKIKDSNPSCLHELELLTSFESLVNSTRQFMYELNNNNLMKNFVSKLKNKYIYICKEKALETEKVVLIDGNEIDKEMIITYMSINGKEMKGNIYWVIYLDEYDNIENMDMCKDVKDKFNIWRKEGEKFKKLSSKKITNNFTDDVNKIKYYEYYLFVLRRELQERNKYVVEVLSTLKKESFQNKGYFDKNDKITNKGKALMCFTKVSDPYLLMELCLDNNDICDKKDINKFITLLSCFLVKDSIHTDIYYDTYHKLRKKGVELRKFDNIFMGNLFMPVIKMWLEDYPITEISKIVNMKPNKILNIIHLMKELLYQIIDYAIIMNDVELRMKIEKIII